MNTDTILELLPYDAPFLFVDEVKHIDTIGVEGCYTFKKESTFYNGHFKNNPVTPGVLLTECCAQIGLVCLGIFLLKQEQMELTDLKIGFSSYQMEFLKPVMPGEKVTVTSKKVYFRFHKLKCEVGMHDSQGDMVCKGILSGMLIANSHE